MEKNTTIVKAINKNVRTSPRKLALVCNFIKGKKADVALRDLEFSRKRIAKDVSKTVKSAISNAENNYQFDIDNLFVKEAYVGKSLVMKRFRPRAKGRASPIKKPFSRITIVLEELTSENITRLYCSIKPLSKSTLLVSAWNCNPISNVVSITLGGASLQPNSAVLKLKALPPAVLLNTTHTSSPELRVCLPPTARLITGPDSNILVVILWLRVMDYGLWIMDLWIYEYICKY